MAKNDTKIRRVKAKDTAEKPSKEVSKTEVKSEISKKPKMSKYAAKVAGVSQKKAKKPLPKWLQIILLPFKFIGGILAIIFKPFRKIFAPIFRYFGESWQELKLVRWPTRKETWKMTAGVLIFAIAFAIFVTALDALFNWTFTTLIGKQ